MKLCPTCKKTFVDHNLSFCIDDGTPLVTVDSPSDETTLVRPSPSASGPSEPPPYQPPRAYAPPGAPPQRKRRVWPWVVAVLAIGLLALVALGIAGAVFIPRMLRATENKNANYNANVRTRNDSNSNLNASNSNTLNQNENLNDNSSTSTAPAPTDKDQVLSDLTDLEHEWTVANINADKKALNRILADDYVGITEGKSQGKAEYLKSIERDTSIQHWDFENLKVNLIGDRATLNGIIRLQVKDAQGQDHDVAYSFTDKFVWRDGRWQATGSEVES
jgi:ketosteroid isomerase-like protein